jgi:anthranilate phosphoribosyltransferase
MTAADPAWPDLLASLVQGHDLSEEAAGSAMAAIMEGEVSPAQVAGLLVGLRAKGETPPEVTGFVRTMRAYAQQVRLDGPAVDTCGTGGDRAGTFNISTLSAIVAAGAGARVAKHGNRAASGRCGSADLLEHLGVAIDLPPSGVEACIAEAGIGFCFAPTYHPAMRHAMPARRDLGVPTLFNFLGPLTNPAGAAHQTIGVSDAAMAPRLAEVLARLGAAHALVFHGGDGLDEVTTTGPSRVWTVREGDVAESTLDPGELGVRRARLDDLKGGSVADNVRIAEAVLGGEGGPAGDVVALGAAAALLAADLVVDWQAGLTAASSAIASGAAADALSRWVAVSQAQASAAGE